MLPPTHLPPEALVLAAGLPDQVPTYLVAVAGSLITLGVLALWTRQAIAVVAAAVAGAVLVTSSGLAGGGGDPTPAPSTTSVVREVGR